SGNDLGSSECTVRAVVRAEDLLQSVALAGCAPALSLWARSAERSHAGLRVVSIHSNSTAALRSLARGEVHIAGIHLQDPKTGEDNVPYVKRELSGRRVSLVNLGSWEEGFVVRPDNPKRVQDASDLRREDLTIVNREQGAGSRLLMDSLML